MNVYVECYAGYMGEETPRVIRLGARHVQVVEVVDRWLAPDHRYFKVRGDDDAVYILRHDPLRSAWELTVFEHLRTKKVGPKKAGNGDQRG